MHAIITRRLVGPAIIAAAVAVMTLAGTAAQAAPRAPGAATSSADTGAGYTPPAGVTDPCPQTSPGDAGCAALTSKPASSPADKTAAQTATPGASAVTPTGYSPTELQAAYDLNASLGTGETVAVVTAYNDPDAASDLATYRSQYDLSTCTTANGCLKQVSQTGTTTLPGTSAGWTAPLAESIDMISAICPDCHILVVEAASSSITDLGTAENEAVTLGAKFIDNDWIVPEASLGTTETTYDSEYFDHPGVAITAPAGDSGYGNIDYPAASPYVVSVGGTTLTQDSSVSRDYTETAWIGTSSGCSAYEPKPSWQTDTGCADRTLNDAAADADPDTPVAYYDTPTEDGWGEGSGTTAAAAIIAATYALAGNPSAGTYPAEYLYSQPGALWPITSGSDGTCTVTYLCTAGPGYNGPAGEGTPLGVTALRPLAARPATVTDSNGTTWVFATTAAGDIEADSVPSGSTTWSGLTSLGGGPWAGYPTALATADGSIWVFGVSGGDVYADRLPSGSTTWSGWTSLGDTGHPVIGQAVPAQDNSGNIWLFARDSNTGKLYADELPSGSSTWTGLKTSLGGDFPSDVAVVVGSGGYMKVAGVTSAGTLEVNNLPSGESWSGWTSVSGATVTGTPSIVQDASGNIRVFTRQASTGDLMATELPAGDSTQWTALSSISSTSDNDPLAWTGSGGYVWILATDTSGNLDENQLNTDGNLTGWVSDGSGFAGVPDVTENTSSTGNVYYLFGVSTSGDLEVNQIGGGYSTWSGWTNLGSSFAGN